MNEQRWKQQLPLSASMRFELSAENSDHPLFQGYMTICMQAIRFDVGLALLLSYWQDQHIDFYLFITFFIQHRLMST